MSCCGVSPGGILQSGNCFSVVDVNTVWTATVCVFDPTDQRIQSVGFIGVHVIAEVQETISARQ